MLTRVDRPYLGREATVIGVDHNWRPTERWNIRTRVFGSQVRQTGQDPDDRGATIWADYELDGGGSQQWIAMQFGDGVQIRHLGPLSATEHKYDTRRGTDG